MIKREQSPYNLPSRGDRERRTEPRLLCSDLLRLSWRLPSGSRRKETAVIEDFSSGGASVFLSAPIEPPAEVTLLSGDHVYHGVARHCERRPNGYVVGVEFEPGSCVAGFAPQHLLDPARLHQDETE